MSLIARLAALEQRQGAAGPYAVLVHVLDVGDAEEQPNQVSARWSERSRRSAGRA